MYAPSVDVQMKYHLLLQNLWSKKTYIAKLKGVDS
jgi:hypothetical protein